MNIWDMLIVAVVAALAVRALRRTMRRGNGDCGCCTGDPDCPVCAKKRGEGEEI